MSLSDLVSERSRTMIRQSKTKDSRVKHENDKPYVIIRFAPTKQKNWQSQKQLPVPLPFCHHNKITKSKSLLKQSKSSFNFFFSANPRLIHICWIFCIKRNTNIIFCSRIFSFHKEFFQKRNII